MRHTRLHSAIFAVLSALLLPVSAFAARADLADAAGGIELDLKSASGIVIEQSTGEVLYEKNADERLEPASVTKVMSLLLIFEALDDGTLTYDESVVGSAHAASMGGSQIWLEEGEALTVDEMIKAMCVVSANDCTVAMAERIAGSEEAFVARMNEKAETLGMTNTHFVNSTGLPVEGHYTTARDITRMTRELLKHEGILDYTTIWMDSLRGGKMALTNTNKLIRFYGGANGMKTGYTSSAKYCLSATAKRDGMQLIAAVMKGNTSDERFSDAKKLLDFGFANFAVHQTDTVTLDPIRVRGGITPYVNITCGTSDVLIPKGREKQLTAVLTVPETLDAPIKAGDTVGHVRYLLGDSVVSEVPVTAENDIARATLGDLVKQLVARSAVFS